MPNRETGDKPKSSIDFRVMSLTYKVRDLRLPRMEILKEVGIQTGFHVLDYGCGPGSYILPLAKLVRESGKIYALDINQIAIQTVERIVVGQRLSNVQTILSDCPTGLQTSSIDVVLLYDILHDLNDVNGVLAELNRVLKPQGILSVSDHHMSKDEIVSVVSNQALFRLSIKNKRTLSFIK